MPNGDAASNGPVAEHLAPPSPTSPSTPPLTPDGLGTPQIVDSGNRDEVEQVVNRYRLKAVLHCATFPTTCLEHHRETT